MKNILFIVCYLLSVTIGRTQSVGIGNSNPDASAILDLTNPDDKGLLIPSMTTSQKNGIENPADGLLVYQTDSTSGFYFFDGTMWGRIGGGGNAWEETDSTVYTSKLVGINKDEPRNHLDVIGNLVISQFSSTTASEPTPAQTKTMIADAEISFSQLDSTGRFFDTGGPNGPYGNGITSTCVIPSYSNTIGYELTLEEIDLNTYDSLIIREGDETGEILLAFGGLNNQTGTYILNETSLHFLFKSDVIGFGTNDGFRMLFKRLFSDNAFPNPRNFAGNSLVYYSQSGSLRVGKIDISDFIGSRSFSCGFNNEASGGGSISFGGNNSSSGELSMTAGSGNIASGLNSCAIGRDNLANSLVSMAFGQDNLASGQYSMAIGTNNIASGLWSMAFGYDNDASGQYSMAMNSNTNASGSYSFSAGNSTSAQGHTAFTSGFHSVANGFASMVIGMYNTPIVEPQTTATYDTPLFIIGNGNTLSDRSNAMVVRKDGNVGLGTNNPRITLHIADGTDAGLLDDDGFLLIGNANGINIVMDDNEIMARDNGAISDLYVQKDGGKVFIGDPVSPSFLLSVNGTAGKNGGGSWSTYSDRRLKDNIRVYSDGLDAILKINPVWFQYNSVSGYDTKTKYVGVIAQELQEVSPYMVTTPAEPLADGSSGYLQVDNSAMTYMLINAVKELHAEIENLKSEIQELRKAK
ncbi:MAG TPA: tail fiber domain-containing protein [Saprospiraceae bacterium]|nr:tail fiber domain-containing protein [Saprospiraceae bacterium]